MAQLINRNGPQPDAWQAVSTATEAEALPDTADALLPLAVWREAPERWVARAGRLGLLLEPTDDPKALAAVQERLSLIAVRFPVFTDGRGYSIARLLRERQGWQGELRAVGDILLDQLFFYARCGFDTFALRDDQEAALAPAMFAAFSVRYQAAADEAQPLFRRVARGLA